MCLTIAFNYRILYDMIQDAILTCDLELWRTEKKLNTRNGYAQNYRKQSGESMESVWKKKRNATVGRIAERKVLSVE